jgi:acyl phosphate:glycerol-3-phosphate acyltransferase
MTPGYLTYYFMLMGRSYLIGSIPTGYWLGKLLRRGDIRKFGSGNLGATNVFRVLGWKAGVFTLIFDILKGWVAIWLATPGFVNLFGHQPTGIGLLWWYGFPRIVTDYLIAGIFVILGHTFSCFVRFRGGKGVATSCGVFLALLPVPAGISLVVFAVCLAITRIVSLSSIAGAIALAVAASLVSPPPALAYFAAVVAVLIIWKHRSNIQRILAGTEARIGTHA